jgi:hypothetical protein
MSIEKIVASTHLEVNRQILHLVYLCTREKPNLDAIQEMASDFASNVRGGEIPDLPEDNEKSLELWQLAVGE